jgi:hypothetical protein
MGRYGHASCCMTRKGSEVRVLYGPPALNRTFTPESLRGTCPRGSWKPRRLAHPSMTRLGSPSGGRPRLRSSRSWNPPSVLDARVRFERALGRGAPGPGSVSGIALVANVLPVEFAFDTVDLMACDIVDGEEVGALREPFGSALERPMGRHEGVLPPPGGPS